MALCCLFQLVEHFLLKKKPGLFSDCSDLFSCGKNPEQSKNWWKRKFILPNYVRSCWCKRWNISEARSSEKGWYACFDTPVISLLGVMSCPFLWGHQLGGMSNCFDWYKMWKSCPGKPVCPCLDVKACRTHKSLILISITSCRLLIPFGTCLSLRKEKLLHWSFPILWHCWLLLHSNTYFPDRVATSHVRRVLPLPTSCKLASFHSPYYWKSQHTWFTLCTAHVGCALPFLCASALQ